MFPLELESRLSPASFQLFVEAINDPLREAYSTSGAVVDNLIGIATWWTSLIWRPSHFEKELRRAEEVIQLANETTFNRVGLNILNPRAVALQYVSSSERKRGRGVPWRACSFDRSAGYWAGSRMLTTPKQLEIEYY